MVLFIDPRASEPLIVQLPTGCMPPYYQVLRQNGDQWVVDIADVNTAWGLRRNLMYHVPATPDDALPRYSSAQVSELDRRYSPAYGYPPVIVDPTYIPEQCK